MSWVTTVVIAGRYIPRGAEEVLADGYTDGQRNVQFGNLSRLTNGVGCNTWNHWRGTKGPESDVFGGAFNHLDADRMLRWLANVPWYGEVLVIVMPEEGTQTYTRLGIGSDGEPGDDESDRRFEERQPTPA